MALEAFLDALADQLGDDFTYSVEESYAGSGATLVAAIPWHALSDARTLAASHQLACDLVTRYRMSVVDTSRQQYGSRAKLTVVSEMPVRHAALAVAHAALDADRAIRIGRARAASVSQPSAGLAGYYGVGTASRDAMPPDAMSSNLRAHARAWLGTGDKEREPVAATAVAETLGSLIADAAGQEPGQYDSILSACVGALAANPTLIDAAYALNDEAVPTPELPTEPIARVARLATRTTNGTPAAGTPAS